MSGVNKKKRLDFRKLTFLLCVLKHTEVLKIKLVSLSPPRINNTYSSRNKNKSAFRSNRR